MIIDEREGSYMVFKTVGLEFGRTGTPVASQVPGYIVERIAIHRLVCNTDTVKRWRCDISSILATVWARVANYCLPLWGQQS